MSIKAGPTSLLLWIEEKAWHAAVPAGEHGVHLRVYARGAELGPVLSLLWHSEEAHTELTPSSTAAGPAHTPSTVRYRVAFSASLPAFLLICFLFKNSLFPFPSVLLSFSFHTCTVHFKSMRVGRSPVKQCPGHSTATTLTDSFAFLMRAILAWLRSNPKVGFWCQ